MGGRQRPQTMSTRSCRKCETRLTDHCGHQKLFSETLNSNARQQQDRPGGRRFDILKHGDHLELLETLDMAGQGPRTRPDQPTNYLGAALLFRGIAASIRAYYVYDVRILRPYVHTWLRSTRLRTPTSLPTYLGIRIRTIAWHGIHGRTARAESTCT
ncbi:hypothetical protein LX36DRAFT_470963 [Colletotrichum falcatum]|nr:hypothetical protein LX36DRAFT_470963 [Colletotrichum falcatum]